jgi:phosphoserine aminotransferase
MATRKLDTTKATEGTPEATEVPTPVEAPTPAQKATEVPKEATETPATPRQAVYHVYAISTKSKEEAKVLADRLARVAKTLVITDGDIYRVQFFPPTTSRNLAVQRLDMLKRYGIHTGHFILM